MHKEAIVLCCRNYPGIGDNSTREEPRIKVSNFTATLTCYVEGYSNNRKINGIGITLILQRFSVCCTKVADVKGVSHYQKEIYKLHLNYLTVIYYKQL
jgi:hypothetical protein